MIDDWIKEIPNWSLGELIERSDALGRSGQYLPAVGLYQLWLKGNTDPNRFVAWFNLSVLLGSLKQYGPAEAACRQALLLKPDLLQAKLNLGHHLENQGRVEDAWLIWKSTLDDIESIGSSAENKEFLLHALNNLARSYEIQRVFDTAEDYLLLSLAVDCTQSSVMSHYVHIRQKQCKWPIFMVPNDLVTINQLLTSTSALAMLAASDEPAMQLLAAREFVANKVDPPAPVPLKSRVVTGRKIRLGYLSGDLCMHAVGLLTVEMFELHDKDVFETFAFCWSKEDGSKVRQRIRAALDHVVPIGHLDDNAAVSEIEKADVDILVDLQGLTNGARPNILMRRPAGAIQISYLGLPGTSALPTVDYILADRYVFPTDLLPYMTEKPLYVDRCYQVSDRKRQIGRTLSRSEFGLTDDQFVFASFNNNYKFTFEMFSCWMRILQGVPNSVLWLLADNKWSEANMRKEAELHGLDQSRIIFTGRAEPTEYLSRLALPDLFLDTYPYNAGTTANDILWMGVPILTLSGRTYISRMCGSLLNAVGLPELIATSQRQYEEIAIRLGTDSRMLKTYKRYLQEWRFESDLFRVDQLVRDIEGAFISILR